MEQIKKFLRGKGFAVAMAACLLAAAAAGIWAVRAVRGELENSLDGLREQSGVSSRSSAGIDESLNKTEEADQWQQQTAPAANSVANVPKEAQKSASSASRSDASGSQSGSGTVLEPQELQTGSAPASSSASQASTQPVLGRMLNAYSGDELVYNKTLGDWRTHNGADYACAEGEAVATPVAGKVVEAGDGGNWGEVVAIEDASGRVWRLCGVTGQKVERGDTVKAGQTIGKAGTVSCECAEASHVHVEIKDGDKYLDPAQFIGAAQSNQ